MFHESSPRTSYVLVNIKMLKVKQMFEKKH